MTQFHFKTCQVCGKTAGHYAGVNSRCAECHKARMKQLRLIDPAYQERDRERAKLPHRKDAAAKIRIRWRQQHPEAYKAQTAVSNAVRDGRLKKGPCGICGTNKSVHGHHTDYSKPLSVRWLCAKCHHRVHATFPELGGHFQKQA